MFTGDRAGFITGALVVIAASLAGFVAWNCIIDMLRPPWGWADRAARVITERLGSRLSSEERVRLYSLIRHHITAAGGMTKSELSIPSDVARRGGRQ
ncbi:MAG: hypothetical protein ACRD9W_06870 [Terriglobia bacterium]